MKTLECIRVANLPKLAWAAVVRKDRDEILVLHGSAVEHADDWLVEGVWDGPFSEGRFHESECFFGSGLRIEGDKVFLVASSGLVDRLFYRHSGGNLLVSNSLPLLLALTGAAMDKSHSYSSESYAIMKGIHGYPKDFRVIHSQFNNFSQLYFQNLIWQDGSLSFEDRAQARHIADFAAYRALLTEAVERIHDNFRSEDREVTLNAYCALSSGYDSTCVASIVKDIGVETCFTSMRSNSSYPKWLIKQAAIDDGTPIANSLGLKAKYLTKFKEGEDEVYFLAASGAEPELIFSSMASFIESTGSGAVVFTGFHGDGIWDAHLSEKSRNDQIMRHDTSGLNWSEIRLKSGFIHVAIPFLYGRSAPSIMDITKSPEMDPWRLANDYDRPIPRRIAEEAGVPRGIFGVKKKAVVSYYGFPIDPALRADFFEFMHKHYGVSGSVRYLHEPLNKAIFPFAAAANVARGYLTGKKRFNKSNFVFRNIHIRRWVYIWAVENLADKYRDVLADYMPAAQMQDELATAFQDA